MDDRGRHQQELDDDIAAVLDYGKRFPGSWTGLKFDGARLVVLFTDPDAHRHEIAALVAHPDRVEVQAAKRTEREVQAVLAEVSDRLASARGCWSSFGPRLDTVAVCLHGNREAIARELHDRFGDAVELTVGAHDYPYADPPALAPSVRAPQSTLPVGAVGLLAIPNSPVVTAGQHVAGQVQITNTASDEELMFDTDQPLQGQLLDRDHIVGISTGFSAGTGEWVRLAPGERTTIRFSAGTDSRDPRTGPVLAPGRYQLIVAIPVHSLAGARLRAQHWVTPPTPIDIVMDPDA